MSSNKKTKTSSRNLLSATKLFKIILMLYILILSVSLIYNNREVFAIVSIIALFVYKLPDLIKPLIYRNKRFTFEEFDLILCGFSPRQFEVFAFELFQVLGYEAYLTNETCDGGKDIILDDDTYVECKRYNESSIGREICQKLLGAIIADNMEYGIIFTNGKVNKNAMDFLDKVDNISLWNSEVIYEEAMDIPSYKLSQIIYNVYNIDVSKECL